MRKPKIIIFDLEFMHLNWGADLGLIYCMAWKELGSAKTNIESVWETDQKDPLDDKELCKRIHSILNEADMLITYNGIRADVPFLQTRLLANGLPQLRPIAHKDVYYTAKFKLKLSRNRLFDVQTFLGFKNEKTPVDLYKWLQALVGNRTAQREILTHCRQDILVLEEAYMKLRPLMQAHPRLYGYGACNKCGGQWLKNKIYYTTSKHHKITLKCQSCGGYDTRPLTKKEEELLTR